MSKAKALEMIRRIPIFIILFLCVLRVDAKESITAVPDDKTTQGMPVEFMRFQAMEKESNYGENWLFFIQQEDGTHFYSMLTITNVGLHTYDCYVNLAFVPAGGTLTKIHKEYRRDKLKASTEIYDVKIAKNRAWGTPPNFHLKIREDNFKADLDFHSELPSYRAGSGKILIGKNKKECGYGINAPRARASGSITVGDKRYSINGHGYHDHEWQTIKATEFSRGGCYLLVWHDDLTIILQDTYLKDAYGGGKLQLGLVGKGGKILAENNRYTMDITTTKKDKPSGYEWPDTIIIDFASDNVKVTGTVQATSVIQNMDMLAELSWPIRFFIRAFVSNPWLHRTWATYDLQVTIGGETQQITGETIPGALYY